MSFTTLNTKGGNPVQYKDMMKASEMALIPLELTPEEELYYKAILKEIATAQKGGEQCVSKTKFVSPDRITPVIRMLRKNGYRVDPMSNSNYSSYNYAIRWGKAKSKYNLMVYGANIFMYSVMALTVFELIKALIAK